MDVNFFLFLFSLAVILISLFRFDVAISLFICVKIFVPKALNLYDFPGFPVISYDRFILFALILVFAVKLIKYKSCRLHVKEFPLHRAMIGLALSALISTIFSVSSMTVGINRLISTVIEGYVMLVMVWFSFRHKDQIMKTYKWILFLLFLTTIYGLINYVTKENGFITWLMDKMEDSDKTLLFSYDMASERFGITGRVQSIFMHPMVFGLYLVFFSSVTLLLLINKKKQDKIFYGVLLVFFAINIFFTNSRTPLIALIMVLLTILYYLKKLKPVLIVTSVVVIGYLLISEENNVVLRLFKSIVFFWIPDDDVGGSSLEMRYLQLLYALALFSQSPVTGLGLGAMRDLINDGSDLLGGESILFWILVEQGIIGLIFFLYSFWCIFNKARKYCKASLEENDRMISIATLAVIPAYFLFIILTGELSTMPVFYIFIAMGFKHHYLQQNEESEAEHVFAGIPEITES